jgi:hypothetical protein
VPASLSMAASVAASVALAVSTRTVATQREVLTSLAARCRSSRAVSNRSAPMIKPNPSPATIDRIRQNASVVRPDRHASPATEAATTAPSAKASTAPVIGETRGCPPSTRWVTLSAAPAAIAVIPAMMAIPRLAVWLSTTTSRLPKAVNSGRQPSSRRQTIQDHMSPCSLDSL